MVSRSQSCGLRQGASGICRQQADAGEGWHLNPARHLFSRLAEGCAAGIETLGSQGYDKTGTKTKGMFKRLACVVMALLLADVCGWTQGGAYTTQFRISPPAPTAPNLFSPGIAKSAPAPSGAATSRRINVSPPPAANRPSGIFIRNRIVSRRRHVHLTALPFHVYPRYRVCPKVSPRLPYNYDLQGTDPAPGQVGSALNPQSSLEAMESNAITVNKARKTSSVTFESTPAGADVYVDGDFVGDTPMTVPMAPGLHTISVRQWGYQVWHRALTITPGRKIAIKASLQEN